MVERLSVVMRFAEAAWSTGAKLRLVPRQRLKKRTVRRGVASSCTHFCWAVTMAANSIVRHDTIWRPWTINLAGLVNVDTFASV